MNIQAEKIELMKMILETENVNLLASVKKLFQKESTDFWDNLPVEHQNDILAGIDEVREGKTVEYSSMMKKHRK